MATYLKRTSKLFDLTLSRASAEVNLRNLICPVCRGILIEPVTLPCTHNLCLRCLKGTFEHNSLSCPLCRVRVGSWLRTATKSETLVNNALWEQIRTRFPKEIEDKHNGDDGDIELDSGFASKKIILSAAGEIRREYEVQLQMAEEEMRRQREAERIANETLIRKIQAEEQQQQLAQLAQDQLLAKTLAKKQLIGNNKEESAMKYYSDCKVTGGSASSSHEQLKAEQRLASLNNISLTNLQGPSLQGKKMDFQSGGDDDEPLKSNLSLVSKIRAERYAAGVKTGLPNIYKESTEKTCCQKTMPIHNAVTRTLKHQAIAKYSHPSSSNFIAEPSCSGTQIYGSRSKEELHVPSDVLSSKKKSLGVEVCMTTAVDDERIGSAESAGSHDSINQEIHHFKPIKPMARTALKMSHDGRTIDPKLIRVVPILKRVSNAVPKPPSPTHFKRILGCSWSAFRGKARQNLELRESSRKLDVESETKASTTALYQSHQMSSKLIKNQVSDTVRRLDLAPDLSFDSNKNYAKNINRILNGTKVSKKLILDENLETGKVNRTPKIQVKNGTIVKNKRQKSLWNDTKIHGISEEGNEEAGSSSCSPETSETFTKISPQRSNYEEGGGCTIENIAERIKRRKINSSRDNVTVIDSQADSLPRSTRRRVQTGRVDIDDTDIMDENTTTGRSKLKRKVAGKATSRAKRQRVCSSGRADDASPTEKVDSPTTTTNESADSYRRNAAATIKKRTTRNSVKTKSTKIGNKNTHRDETDDESYGEDLETDGVPSTSKKSDYDEAAAAKQENDIDEQAIQEQQRMERLILQEKADFELALRLQAQFDDMERIAGRTRGSRRALENNSISTNAGRLANGEESTGRLNTAKQGTASRSVNSQSSKQRRRPQKHAVK